MFFFCKSCVTLAFKKKKQKKKDTKKHPKTKKEDKRSERFFPRRLFQKGGSSSFLTQSDQSRKESSLSPLSLSLSLCRAPPGSGDGHHETAEHTKDEYTYHSRLSSFQILQRGVTTDGGFETGRFNVAGRGARFTSSAPSDAVASPTAEDEDDSEEIFSVTSDGSFIAPFLRTDLLEILCRVKADAFVAHLFVAWWSARVVFEANHLEMMTPKFLSFYSLLSKIVDFS